MAQNDFLTFCPTDTGTNLLNEADYLAATDRVSGNKPGIASSQLNNKAIRQANAVASQVAQFIANRSGADILDDANTARLLAQITGQLTPYAPVITKYTSSTGTHNVTYLFQIASGSATAAATYTNNSITYTVVATVASGVLIKMTGSGAPLVSGTLTKASGAGDATLTFYSVRAPLYLRVIMVGGGAGGSGSGTTGAADGANGGDTTFGTTLLSAGGGVKGVYADRGGLGGVSSLGTGPVGIALPGGAGGSASLNQTAAAAQLSGPNGGSSALGGAGFGAPFGGSATGGAGQTNTGGGGGGAGTDSTVSSKTGAGGGSGGFIDAVINSPLSTYAYAVGAAGGGGGAGTAGGVGGAGGSGLIVVIENYQ